MNAALAIVLVLSPRTFALFFGDSAVWTSSSILGIALGAIAMTLQAWRQYGMPRDEAEQIHWAWHFVAWSLAVGVASLFVLALVDTSMTSAYLVAAVSLMIPLSLTVFIGVVFRRFFQTRNRAVSPPRVLRMTVNFSFQTRLTGDRLNPYLKLVVGVVDCA